MAGRVRSHRQVQLQRSRELRAAGRTWGEVAAIFRREYAVNARVALRLAHGWSQGDVAERWNERWPDDPKTFKNISYWEQWPATTGYAPSLEVLTRLADIYQCHVAELLADATDHRGEDPNHQARQDLHHLPDVITPDGADPDGQTHDRARDRVVALLARLEECDVQELARQTANWAAQLDPAIDRRSLLLKLSFALTVAAAAPLAVEGDAALAAPGQAGDLSGIWRSAYTYYSTGRGKDFTGVHYVAIRQQGTALVAESLPHTTGSRLRLDLALDGMTATGSWEERTSPTGYYKGAVYRGAMQLLVNPSGGQITGRWLGFGKRFQINNGDWELTLESRSLSRSAIKDYELRA